MPLPTTTNTTHLPFKKLEPLKFDITERLETMELRSLHPLGNTTTLLPPVPTAATPTIRLSVPVTSQVVSPDSSHQVGAALIASDNELGGISNAGYLTDGSGTPMQLENEKQSSHLSSDRDGFMSSPSPSIADSIVSTYGEHAKTGPHTKRALGISISDSLGLPHTLESMMAKRFSLPTASIAAAVGHLSPNSALTYKSSDLLSGGTGISPNSSLINNDVLLSSQSGRSSWTMGSWFQKRPSCVSSVSSMSDVSYPSNSLDEDNGAANTRQKLQALVKTVTQRAKKIGRNNVTPISTISATLAPPPAVHNVRKRLDSFAPSSVTDIMEEVHVKKFNCCRLSTVRNVIAKYTMPMCIDPRGGMWLAWLSVVAMVYIYNAVSIFLRASFPEETIGLSTTWLYFDYIIADTVCVLDIMLRMRIVYFSNGQIVRDKALMRKHYTSSVQFKFDVLCLLPLDLLYFAVGILPILRFPRLIKVHSYNEFVEKFENKSKSANIFRVVKTIGYMLYMIHLNTCLYYVISEWEGIDSNDWVYDGEGNAYIRCLYRATKTLITIGNLPEPITTFEIFFMNLDFMVGVFVFATIIGQMRDIVGAAGATKGAFRRRMDNTMSLLKIWKIPDDVQRRVRLWFMYSWDRRELLDEKEVMKNVPIKMQTDIAIHVHMDTLSKVSLFQDCDKMLLRDLVLKLRPVLFLPGDYICRKGEVGKEMYIIKTGVVQVLGGQKNRTVLATLHPGSYFGEISLLSVGSGNRRTADVYSPGYANVFVLDKKVHQEVVVNYPDAQESLKRKAREILRKNQANDNQGKKRRGKSLIAESILRKENKDMETRFFNAVLEVAHTNKLASTILRGSYRSEYSMDETEEVVHFSKSDISEDEVIFGNREQRKRRKKLVKRAKKHRTPDANSNDDSESPNEQRVSDTERDPPLTRRLNRRAASVVSPNPGELNVLPPSAAGRTSSHCPRESMGNMNLLWDKEDEVMLRTNDTWDVPLESEEGVAEEEKPIHQGFESSFSGIQAKHRLARSISDVERRQRPLQKKSEAPSSASVLTGEKQLPNYVVIDDGRLNARDKLPQDDDVTIQSVDSEVYMGKGVSSSVEDSDPASIPRSVDSKASSTVRAEGYNSSSEASSTSQN